MSLTGFGFTGTVSDVQDARRSRFQGAALAVVGSPDDFKVTINSAATLTCDVAPGVACGGGVYVSDSSAATVTFDPVLTVGATRWDAVVIRRDWSAKTYTLVVVKGTAAVGAPQVPPTLNSTFGTLHDQCLAIVKLTYNQNIPSLAVSQRLWSSASFTAPDLTALPAPSLALYGLDVSLVDGTRYRCLLDGSNNPAWLTQSSNVVELLGASVFSSFGAGFDRGATNTLINRGLKDGRSVTLDILLRRSGVAINCAAADGHFPDGTTICTVVPALRPDRETNVLIKYRANAADPRSLGGMASLGSDGVLTLLSGIAGQDLIQRTGESFSLSASARFDRKVA